MCPFFNKVWVFPAVAFFGGEGMRGGTSAPLVPSEPSGARSAGILGQLKMPGKRRSVFDLFSW